MEISVTDYLDVKTKCESLGFTVPAGVCMLPNNLEELESLSESIHFGSVLTVGKLLTEAKVPVATLEPHGEQRKYLVQKNNTWYGPILFFAVAEISQNPELLSVSLGAIANYLTDIFRGVPAAETEVTLSIVTEQTKTKKTRRFDYKGSVEGLRVLEERVLKEVSDEASD